MQYQLLAQAHVPAKCNSDPTSTVLEKNSCPVAWRFQAIRTFSNAQFIYANTIRAALHRRSMKLQAEHGDERWLHCQNIHSALPGSTKLSNSKRAMFSVDHFA